MPARRETPPALTIRVQEEGGRYLLRLGRTFGSHVRAYHAVVEALRDTFPTHADRTWRPTAHAWSIPGRRRRQLEEWLARQQRAGVAVVWEDPAEAPQSA